MSISIKAYEDGLSGAITTNSNDIIKFDQSGITQGAPLSFRNKVINGNMAIDQRNNGAAVTSASTGAVYLIDRFYQFSTVASKLTVQQVAAPAGFSGFMTAAKITVAAAYTPTTNDLFAFNHSIEGNNIRDLGWGTSTAKPVTLSFLAQASVAGIYSVTILNKVATRSYVTTYSLAANTPTKVSITIPGETSGAWSIDNTVGLFLIFGLGSGTTYTTPSTNTWNSGNYQFASNSTQFVSTVGATFYLTGVQLEVGEIATPFEHRPFGLELSLCQRYYELVGVSAATASGAVVANLVAATQYSARKRTTPTITRINDAYLYVASGTTGGTSYLASDICVVAYRTCNGAAQQQQFSELVAASAEL